MKSMTTGSDSPHRRRVLRAVDHLPVDRVPTDMWATTEVQENLFDFFGISTGKGESVPGIGLFGGGLSRTPEATLQLWDELQIDGMFFVSPPYIGPPPVAPPKELSGYTPSEGDGITFSEWGFGHKPKGYGLGSYNEQVVYPLLAADSVDDLDRFRWPSPDWYDYDELPRLIDRCGGRAVGCGYAALFTYHNYLRGLETSLVDPLVSPDITREIIRRLSEFF